MPHLEIDGAVKRYGGKTVLHGIDLALGQGEFVSLLGPSGCGKTTLLRIVAGFERPDGGRVVLAGSDITALPAARRNMGMVFQAYSLFPNMTAEENVRFGLKVRRENVPKPLREWMQRRGKWNDTTYRRADWSAWHNIAQEMKRVLRQHHQYLNAWLDQRHQIYQH